jgi:hypothetical protein
MNRADVGYRAAPKVDAPAPSVGPISVDRWCVSEGRTLFGRRYVRAQLSEGRALPWLYDAKHGLRQGSSPWFSYSSNEDLPKAVLDAMLRLYRGYER